MAPKRPTNDLPPPTHSSKSESEDEEHSSSSSSSSDDSSDSEPQQLTQSKPQQLTQSKPHQESQESSGSDSDSGSDADSDSSSHKTQTPPPVVSTEPTKPTSKSTQLKPNLKRPAETEQIEKVSKTKKNKGVESPAETQQIEKVSNIKKSKAPAETGQIEKVSKTKKSKATNKGKISNGDEEGGEIDDKKANSFARLFTENDEIALLEGMVDYKETKGADPSLDIGQFHEFVKDSMSCSVTKSQFGDKIRRLRKKFMNYVRKGRNGEDPVISKPHEYKSFQVSKKIWGSEVDGDSRVKSSKRKNKKGDIEEEVTDKTEADAENCWSLYPSLCASLESEAVKNFTGPIGPKEFVKKVVSKIKKEKAIELENEWNGFILMEQQVYAKRMKIISDQAEIVMNVIQP